MKEWHGFLDAVEVGWDLDPLVESVPLTAGCGVLVDLGRGEIFGDRHVCSIVQSRFLAAHGRRHSLQEESWGKKKRKCSRKLWKVRRMSLEAASASVLSSPVIPSTDA